MTTSVNECYHLLGLPPDAGPADVKRAYKRLALALHPDRLPGDESAREDFCRVTEAYAVLRDAAGVAALKREEAMHNYCVVCGRTRPVRRGRDGRRRCADCAMRRLPLRLPMEPWTKVRCVGVIALQAGSAACTLTGALIQNRSLAATGIVLAVAALAALSHAVMTSVVQDR